jgi:hypothetical protein
MSKRLAAVLPDGLLERLKGDRFREQRFQVLLLITLDENGWPYPSMLSYLEVIAPNRENIRMAPWNNSTATANLRRNPKATLLVVEEGLAYYIQGTATEVSPNLEGFPGMAKINLKLESILEDKALDYEGSARISTGVRFENPQLDEAYLERARRILEALTK